ncbi:MAG TPA: hypothetical protein VK890_08245, partial [Bacteroidia bacterium]|nr:hypothetical protein [Bacteroidia bacterium]
MTEYTPDNTGRIKRQSIAGKTHRLSSGHETQYFYGKPAQEELDRLFGSEVGYNSHYLENMVMDANGQISVSYVDENGKTVATALAGQLPSNMKPISSYYNATTLNINLLDKDSIHPTKTSILSSYTLLATNTGRYYFTYKLFPGNLTDSACSAAHICTDCLYDIQLVITGDCECTGLPILHYDSNFSYTSKFDTLCGHLNVTDTFSVVLTPGEYNISRLITVDPKAIGFYTGEYDRKNTCLKSYSNFLSTSIAKTDFGGCNMTCATCLSSLGTLASFVNKFITELHTAGEVTSTHADTINADTAWYQAQAQCNQLCATFSPCTSMYNAMLADVSLGGQYCTYTLSGATYAQGDATSMLSSSAYPHPNPAYKDAAGNIDSVLISGVKYCPKDLSVTDFVINWKPSWAASLVIYHPEYCFYKYCTKDSASNRWDEAFENTTTYAAACSAGYLAPLGFGPSCPGGSGCGTSNPDPYFQGGGMGSAAFAAMKHRLDKYITFTPTPGGTSVTLSLWGAVALSMYCSVDSLKRGHSMAGCYSAADTTICGACTGNANMEWNLFKGMYMSLKQHIHDSMESIWIGDSCGSMGHITCVGQVGCDGGVYASPKQPRYNTYSSAKLATESSNFIPQTTTTPKHYYDSAMTANCNSTCLSYATYWYNKLDSCGVNVHTDSARLIARLVAVCKAGCNANHPFGSSTTPHAEVDDSGDVSFEHAITTVLGVSATSAMCNAVDIAMPPPWKDSTGIFGPPITYTIPPTCQCSMIKKFDSLYNLDSLAGFHTFKNFGDFLSKYLGDSISESAAWQLKEACSDTSCYYLANPIQLPISLTCCDTFNIFLGDSSSGHEAWVKEESCCIHCSDIKTAIRFFHDIASPAGADTLPGYPEWITNYLNQTFGFNLTFNEYWQFYGECMKDFDSSYILHKVFGTPRDTLRDTLHIMLCSHAENGTPVKVDTNTCYTYLMMDAKYNAITSYNNYMDSVQSKFKANYIAHCMQVNDSFHLKMPFDEYHYTLYYYDQAENLVKTVPPQGVHPITLTAIVQKGITKYRDSAIGSPTYPMDSLQTRYFYNTLNSPIKQQTPDGDSVHFWYDRLGRIVLSQNALQRSLIYSYTQYDALNRITEVGQLSTVPANLPSCFHCISCIVSYGVLPVLPDTFTRNDAELQNFINQSTKTQVVHTYYDTAQFTYIPLAQQNLRKRISSVSYQDIYDNLYTGTNWIHEPKRYDNAIHYSYDVEGYVTNILIDVPHDSIVRQRYKRINYYYDLVSGNINELAYEQDSIDQFIHNYEY